MSDLITRTSDGFSYGHNGGPPETEPLKSYDEIDLELLKSLKMHFFKMDIQACLRALLALPLEARGFYITALLTMYDRKGPLPADDRVAANLLGVPDLRVYRRVKSDLLTRKLIFTRADGRVSNDRFEDEIVKYVNEIRLKKAAASKRENEKKSALHDGARKRVAEQIKRGQQGVQHGPEERSQNGLEETYGPMFGKPKPLSSETSGGDFETSPAREAEKINDFNECSTRALAHLCQSSGNDLPISRFQTLDSKVRDSVPLDRVRLEGTLSDANTSDGSLAARKLKALTAPVTKLEEPPQYRLDVEPQASGVKGGKVRYEYPPDYEAFWKAYPETTGMSKADGARAWAKLKPAERTVAMASLPAWKALWDDRRKKSPDATLLHVQGFLNQKRFESLAEKPEAAGDPSRPWWLKPEKLAIVTDDDWAHLIRKHANGTWPIDKLGPPPVHRGCKAPAHVIDQLGVRDMYDRMGNPVNGEGRPHG